MALASRKESSQIKSLLFCREELGGGGGALKASSGRRAGGGSRMGARLASNWAMGKEQCIGLPRHPMKSFQAEKKKKYILEGRRSGWGEMGQSCSGGQPELSSAFFLCFG